VALQMGVPRDRCTEKTTRHTSASQSPDASRPNSCEKGDGAAAQTALVWSTGSMHGEILPPSPGPTLSRGHKSIQQHRNVFL
jgi:hypothetical protein